MDFVNEEDDLALGAHDFVEHGFEAFLEFAAKLSRPAISTPPEIEADIGVLPEAVGYVAGDDAAGKSLDDGGLARRLARRSARDCSLVRRDDT